MPLLPEDHPKFSKVFECMCGITVIYEELCYKCRIIFEEEVRSLKRKIRENDGA